jgi:hypothetical protein
MSKSGKQPGYKINTGYNKTTYRTLHKHITYTHLKLKKIQEKFEVREKTILRTFTHPEFR